MRVAAIFVLSDVRSGSTLLDQCLGAHPEIMSLGEVHWLPAYLAQDRTLYDPEHPLVCTCGAKVDQCPFWMAVATRLARPLEELQLRSSLKAAGDGTETEIVPGRVARRLVRRFPALLRRETVQTWFGAGSMAHDLTALYDAVSDVSGRPYCIDSSKSAIRFRAVYAMEPSRTKALVLVRDFRAVVHSKMKRGLAFEAAAIGWRRKMEEIEALTVDLPPGVHYQLKYEDLCQDPVRKLGEVCEFLGIRFVPAMLERPRLNVHHIGGSPSKFDDSKARISLDRSFERHFQPPEVMELRRLIGPVAGRWGYGCDHAQG
jgi:hypothetical protein